MPNEGFRDCGQFSASWSMARWWRKPINRRRTAVSKAALEASMVEMEVTKKSDGLESGALSK